MQKQIIKKYSKDEILNLAKSKVPHGSIIYFLVNEQEIVYVGRSTKGIKRIFDHKDKEFDSYFYYEVPKPRLSEVENYYIIKFRPCYNKIINWNVNYISISKAMSILRNLYSFVNFYEEDAFTDLLSMLNIEITEINNNKIIPKQALADIISYIETNYNIRMEVSDEQS